MYINNPTIKISEWIFLYFCTSNLKNMEKNQPSELEKKVRNVIEQIRPYLQADGGDIEFISLSEDNVVNVELHGACGSCPYSRLTLKNGVEEAMKRAVPEVKSVESEAVQKSVSKIRVRNINNFDTWKRRDDNQDRI